MIIEKVGDIVDLPVDDEPEVVLLAAYTYMYVAV